MKHYYPNVPGIGNVAVSRHAQDRLAEDGVSEREFETVLLHGDSVPEGQDILWRRKDGIRFVILLKPEPFRGATLVKTAYRIEPQAKATSLEVQGTAQNAPWHFRFCFVLLDQIVAQAWRRLVQNLVAGRFMGRGTSARAPGIVDLK